MAERQLKASVAETSATSAALTCPLANKQIKQKWLLPAPS
jgi:hypothetical protein